MFNLIWATNDPLPGTDRGLAYGDGLFETIRIHHGRALLLERHIARLTGDAQRLRIPVCARELFSVVAEAIHRLGPEREDSWVLKLILTRGCGGRGYRPPPDSRANLIISAGAVPPAVSVPGVVVGLSRFPLTVNPQLAGMKTLNRLEQVMASRELTDSLYEVIMTDRGGRLIEGTRTNLLLRNNDTWVTPPRGSLAVAGVMRGYVLASLEDAGHQIREQAIKPSMLTADSCRGLYLLNSVIGAVPVRRIGCLELPLRGGLETICSPLDALE